MPRLSPLLLAALALLAFVAAWPGPTLEQWLEPTGFGRSHDTALLVGVVVGYGFAVLSLPLRPPGPDATRRLGLLLLTALAALAVQGLFALYLVTWVWALAHRPAPDELRSPQRARAAALLAVLGLAGLAVARLSGGSGPERPSSHAEAAQRALDEGNRHRALYHARLWRSEEGEPPGMAQVFLARVAHALHEMEAARELAEVAAAQGRSDDVQGAGRALLEAWR